MGITSQYYDRQKLLDHISSLCDLYGIPKREAACASKILDLLPYNINTTFI